jgi:hypothetical protein
MNLTGVFTSQINHRLMKTARSAAIFVMILFITSSFEKRSDRDLRAKQANILIRQIGHSLLLQSGDSVSRVLPITQIKEGTFQLRFEKKIVFNPDSLMGLARSLFPATEFPSGYIVTVHDCGKGGIVSGFMVNHSSPDVLACKGRSQPAGCYSIEFSFPDFYDNAPLQKTGVSHTGGLAKADASGSSDDSIIFGLTATMLFAGVGFLFLRSRKNKKASASQHHVSKVSSESQPELPSLGKYQFNVNGQYLRLGTEMTTLTDKECKVLELLHNSFGELITRDTLMQEIWLNEGVITGRSLDMFVSKLRKKLSGDPELGITNVHGKGYKLEKVDAG